MFPERLPFAQGSEQLIAAPSGNSLPEGSMELLTGSTRSDFTQLGIGTNHHASSGTYASFFDASSFEALPLDASHI